MTDICLVKYKSKHYSNLGFMNIFLQDKLRYMLVNIHFFCGKTFIHICISYLVILSLFFYEQQELFIKRNNETFVKIQFQI